MSNRVVLVTTTFVKSVDDLRAQLSLRMVEQARNYGFELVVVDGSTTEEFKQRCAELGAVVFPEQAPGMGASRRQAIAKASEIAQEDGIVVWLEPEKFPLIRSIKSIVDPIIQGRADWVIPARSQAGWSSYPKEQVLAEQLGNMAFKYLTGEELDIWFGPIAFRSSLAHHFLGYSGEYGDLWDSIHIPRLQLLKGGHRVASVEVDYEHPEEQTQQESGDMDFFKKRMDQLRNLILSFEAEARRLGLV